jgi:hypothetical protein
VPSLSALVDNFNDGVIGANWGNSYGGVTETGGRARVPCTTGFAGYQTAYSWTLAGASFYVAVLTAPAASTATEAYASVFVNAPGIGDTTGPQYGYRIGFLINTVTGQLRCKNDVSYADAASVDITYDPVAHKFLRLREDGTSVYWDTSPDGTTWTNRRTLATPAWVTSSVDTCAIDLSAHRDAGTGDYAEYDLFNTLNDGAVWTASAALSAQTSLTAALRIAAHATVGLSAGTGLGAALRVSARTAAQLTAAATLTAVSEDPRIREVAGMPAGTYHLLVEQGATLVRTITCAIDDPSFTWAGWSPRAQVRTVAAANGELLLDLTPYLSVAGPTITLLVPAAVTANLTRNGVWDLELAKDGTVVRLLEGRVDLSPEVTR